MPTRETKNPQNTSPDNSASDDQVSAINSGSKNDVDKHQSDNPHAKNKSRPRKPQLIDISSIPKIDVIEGVEANKIAGTANEISERANVISNTANSISRFSVWINIFIFLVTGGLFTLATCQYHSALKAQQHADTTDSTNQRRAESTLKADTTYNNKTLKNQQIANRKTDSLDSIKNNHDGLVFDYQKKSLGAQIAAIHETQKEFEIENRPVTQVFNIKINPIVSKKPWSISFVIVKFGRQPIKGIVNKYTSIIMPIYKRPVVDDRFFLVKKTNVYLFGDAREEYTWTSEPVISKADSIEIVNGRAEIYLIGNYTYLNTVTYKTYKYIYNYKFQINGDGYSMEGIEDTTIKIIPFDVNKK